MVPYSVSSQHAVMVLQRLFEVSLKLYKLNILWDRNNVSFIIPLECIQQESLFVYLYSNNFNLILIIEEL